MRTKNPASIADLAFVPACRLCERRVTVMSPFTCTFDLLSLSSEALTNFNVTGNYSLFCRDTKIPFVMFEGLSYWRYKDLSGVDIQPIGYQGNRLLKSPTDYFALMLLDLPIYLARTLCYTADNVFYLLSTFLDYRVNKLIY